MADAPDAMDGAAPRARFAPGDLVHHRRFDYRGVVADVDAVYSLDEDWYEQNAVTRPLRDRPWYHVLVDGSATMTYVAERNLERDDTGEPVRHPLIEDYFEGFQDGRYVPSLPTA